MFEGGNKDYLLKLPVPVQSCGAKAGAARNLNKFCLVIYILKYRHLLFLPVLQICL
jgi:hypothetical protein